MAVEWEEAPLTMIHLAEELIKEHHPFIEQIGFRIGFILRSEEATSGGKTIIAKTTVVPAHLRERLELDFMIWVAKPFWHGADLKRCQALIDHELCHIASNGSGGPAIRGHDIDEFIEIIDRYGFWNRDLFQLEVKLRQLELFKTPQESGNQVSVKVIPVGQMGVLPRMEGAGDGS